MTQNQIMGTFKEMMAGFSSDERMSEAIESFEHEHEGMVLEVIIVESDKIVENPEKEILPEIKKQYPDAILFSCEELPHFTTKK